MNYWNSEALFSFLERVKQKLKFRCANNGQILEMNYKTRTRFEGQIAIQEMVFCFLFIRREKTFRQFTIRELMKKIKLLDENWRFLFVRRELTLKQSIRWKLVKMIKFPDENYFFWFVRQKLTLKQVTRRELVIKTGRWELTSKQATRWELVIKIVRRELTSKQVIRRELMIKTIRRELIFGKDGKHTHGLCYS